MRPEGGVPALGEPVGVRVQTPERVVHARMARRSAETLPVAGSVTNSNPSF